jgi:hypothetical protein
MIFALLVHAHVSHGMATALSLFVDLQMVPFAVMGGLVFLVEHRRRRAPGARPGRLDPVPVPVYPEAAGLRKRSRLANE